MYTRAAENGMTFSKNNSLITLFPNFEMRTEKVLTRRDITQVV